MVSLSSMVLSALWLVGATAAATSSPTSAVQTPTPPTPCPPRQRRSWYALSPQDKDMFFSALELAMDRGTYQKFVLIHTEMMNFREAHGTCAFLFWHRVFLLGFENMLRDLGPRFRCLTLPYWDYVQDYSAMKTLQNCSTLETCSSIITEWGGSTTGKKTTKSIFGYDYTALKCVTARPLNHLCEVAGASDADCDHCVPRGDWWQLDMPFEISFESIKGQVFSSTNIRNMSAELESSPHNFLHAVLTGPMVDPGVSPIEPFFFLLHTSIDMLHTVFYHCKVEPLNLTDGQKKTHPSAFQGCTNDNEQTIGPLSSVMMHIDGDPVIDVVNDPLVGKYFRGLPTKYYKLPDSRNLGNVSYSYEYRGLLGTLYGKCEGAPVPDTTLPPADERLTIDHVVVPVEKQENLHTLAFEDEVMDVASTQGLTRDQVQHEIRKMGLLYHEHCLPGKSQDYSDEFKRKWHVQGKPKSLELLEAIASGADPMLIPSWAELNFKYFGCRGDEDGE
ncbi:Aste57867_20192 [Aphanomyces stellatus]|uniref:Aste57867_20192 protein n=1 Tax=Aphanomyces stellatus TaxID=120398 RepID=A0A485LJ45_9STRA|nr:hypothetical protein As57867_020126 [Aphanomyces stellatus]VFT96886.1 Aste57867_20192 [Aphanomyces stellatus]